LNIIEEDKLNRKEEIGFLSTYILNRYELKKDEAFVLNINAQWGYGKTYFLQSMKQELEKNHKVIYFDAWKNDFTKEPLLAFMSKMNEDLESYFKTKNKKVKSFLNIAFKNSLPMIISILSKQLTGCTFEELSELNEEESESNKSEAQESENKELSSDLKLSVSTLLTKATEVALKEHNSLRKSIDKFKDDMKSLLEVIGNEKDLPLFILIDELDRCRPNYAIELLENIKHIFDIPGIIFIVATDSKQLSHSINAVYGSKFASEKYLKRFFDQEYSLKEPDKYEYIKFLFDKEIPDRDIFYNPLLQHNYADLDLNIVLFKTFADYFKLGLRDIIQCMNTLLTITLTWKGGKIHLAYILFFIMLKQISDENVEFNINIRSFGERFFKELLEKRYSEPTVMLNCTMANQGDMRSIPELIIIYNKIASITTSKQKIDMSNNTRVREYENLINYFFNNEEEKLLNQYPNLVLNAGQLS